jgi:hypothetical protein
LYKDGLVVGNITLMNRDTLASGLHADAKDVSGDGSVERVDRKSWLNRTIQHVLLKALTDDVSALSVLVSVSQVKSWLDLRCIDNDLFKVGRCHRYDFGEFLQQGEAAATLIYVGGTNASLRVAQGGVNDVMGNQYVLSIVKH